MSPEQLDGADLDARADKYSLAAVLYHLIAGRPPFEAAHQAALMHQICNAEPPPLASLRDGVPDALDAIVRKALAKSREERYADWDEFAQALSALVARRELPRGTLREVLDSERFNLLRSLDFFSGFGDVELWEVVHRAEWQRHAFGAALFRKGQQGGSFHIIAAGRVEVYRDGRRVAELALAPRWARWSTWRRAPTCACTAPTWWCRRPRPRSRSRPRRWTASASPRATCSTWRSSACWCAGCMRRTRRWHHPRRIL